MKRANDWETLYLDAACGLISFKLSGEIIQANRTMLTWLSMTPEELYAINFQELLNSGSKLYYNLFIVPLLELKKEVNEVSLLVKNANDDLPVLFNAVMQDNDEKQINASFFRINDRKKFELEILKEKETIKDLMVMRNQALGQIAYSHAHLIRVPLANVLGLLSLLEMESFEPMVLELVSRLKESATQLDKVTKEIIDQATF